MRDYQKDLDPKTLLADLDIAVYPAKKIAPADMKVYHNGDITGYNDVGAAEYYTGFFTFVAAS